MAAPRMPSTVTSGYSPFEDEPVEFNDTFKPGEVKKSPQPTEDFPNELGSTSSLNRSQVDNVLELTETGDYADADQHWEMNYHEASIFLEEGENNEKFDSHPHNPAALPAYLLVHNRWYYGLDMATSIVLLVLAFVEDPAIPYFKVPVAAASSVELLALSVITIELAMKLRWIGWRTILKHKRTMLKGLTLGIMFMEAITVLIRQSSHFRVTRALRPIFLVDTRHCGPVRRFIRQIFQSLPPILDMMGLLLFFICIYSLLGFYLFSSYKHTHHFDTLQDSFVSMFVLLTTANFPDVMMPLYSKSKWYSIFFISYLCIVLYVLMNLMLAVVYETFTRIERDKFRKLLLHKRKACQHAFRLLVSKQNPNKVRFKQFEGLMRYYAPKKSLLDTVLMFKELNVSGSGSLSLEEFYSVYDAALLRWEPQFSHIPWFHTTWPPLQKLCQLAHDAVNWQYFEPCVYVITLCNGVAMVIRLFNESSNLEEAAVAFCASWDTFTFIGLYAVEAMLRVMGFGVGRYFKSGWNVYDFLVNVAALLGAVVLYIVPSFVYVVVFRPLRLLRLFKLKKRYRDVFGTLVLLTPLMCSTAIVMLVLYYFFAIVGMELFAGYDMKNCCSNSSVEDFYKWSSNGTTALGYYYLNTFDNIATSGITLFELTIVNNWFILMNSYAIVVSPFSRVYFMLFYLFTMVVLTIVVASVLEAFRFRIQYKRQTSKREEEKLLHEEVHVEWEEMQSWVQDFQLLEKLRGDLVVGGTATFIGCRPRNREVLQQRMYRAEIDEWMKDAEMTEQLAESIPNPREDEHLITPGQPVLTYQQPISINS
ncbi:two pore calcium channel protein 1-like isoform X2 [Bacillus rossius redtenbacheri]|uniref:two pore calcium channel protein 1-like isoform X2 n=1 Tax=Bacillus rossius redtenbacheri TaxID=93214 RepID=UPI002FDE9881